MYQTVAQYAQSRQLSESTVKAHIRRLDLQLPQNPTDKRQRIITTDMQTRLDTAIGCQPPAGPDAITVEVMPAYERPESVSMVIAEAQAETAIATFVAPGQNPLLLALQQQVQSMEAQNAQHHLNLQSQAQTYQDSKSALDAFDQLRIIQNARAQAAQEYQLTQQVRQQALIEFEMQGRGLSVPQSPAPPAPAPPPPAPTVREEARSASSDFSRPGSSDFSLF